MAWYARYSPTGHLLVVTGDGKLAAAPFDLKKLALTGPPIGFCSRGSASRSAGSRRTSPCQTTAPWSIPPALRRATSGSQYGWAREGQGRAGGSPSWQPQGVIGAFAVAPDGHALAVEMGPEQQQRRSGSSSFRAGPIRRLRPSATPPTCGPPGPPTDVLLYISRTRLKNGGIPAVRRADGTGTARMLLRSPFTFGTDVRDAATASGWSCRRSFFEAGAGDIYAVRRATRRSCRW